MYIGKSRREEDHGQSPAACRGQGEDGAAAEESERCHQCYRLRVKCPGSQVRQTVSRESRWSAMHKGLMPGEIRGRARSDRCT